MAYLFAALIVALLFLGVDWLLRFRVWSRIVLGIVFFTWALTDSILSSRGNPSHEFGSFAVSFVDSLVPFALWQWLAKRIIDRRQHSLRL